MREMPIPALHVAVFPEAPAHGNAVGGTSRFCETSACQGHVQSRGLSLLVSTSENSRNLLQKGGP